MNLLEIAKQIPDTDSAREYLETLRWKDGIVCPHCGVIDGHYALKAKADSVSPARKGVYKCKDCRKQFTVTVGTIFEKSHIPLHKWVWAIYLLCASKKGMSALQLSRMLEVTYKSAWFMTHRIRLAMTQGGFEKLDGIVEADETYIGGKKNAGRGRSNKKKAPVLSLVERGGRVRSKPVDRVTSANLKGFIRDNVESSAIIMTDDFSSYNGLDKEFVRHDVVKHSAKEYANGSIHTNTVEGYFSLLKRGIVGIYHHVDKKHLQKYLAEFDFRYNARKTTDTERMEMVPLPRFDGHPERLVKISPGGVFDGREEGARVVQ